jgi:hypothetical protein
MEEFADEREAVLGILIAWHLYCPTGPFTLDRGIERHPLRQALLPFGNGSHSLLVGTNIPEGQRWHVFQ